MIALEFRLYCVLNIGPRYSGLSPRHEVLMHDRPRTNLRWAKPFSATRLPPLLDNISANIGSPNFEGTLCTYSKTHQIWRSLGLGMTVTNLLLDLGSWIQKNLKQHELFYSTAIGGFGEIITTKQFGWPGRLRLTPYALSSAPFKRFDVATSSSAYMSPPRFKFRTRHLSN
ncbi:hypothetical protein PIB30_035215 [Stylosanthes scabra]|uniref:Uncharacterized protein n=1 Tax=Stylosanthes scabra TaxID=79078 RepID=A0ABU6SDI1_9FABA|nr:hypothetical protein [Stylosanthes scabra]